MSFYNEIFKKIQLKEINFFSLIRVEESRNLLMELDSVYNNNQQGISANLNKIKKEEVKIVDILPLRAVILLIFINNLS